MKTTQLLQLQAAYRAAVQCRMYLRGVGLVNADERFKQVNVLVGGLEKDVDTELNKTEAKTIAQLWAETPQGSAILAPDYQAFCALLECETARSVESMAREIDGLFNMTPDNAGRAVLQWATKKKCLDPNFLAEYKERQRKEFFRE